MRIKKPFAVILLTAMVTSACVGQSAEAICNQAVGQLEMTTVEYEELLESGVSKMRSTDAITELRSLSDDFSTLLDSLNENSADVPPEARDAHEHLASGIRLQIEAWNSIADGLRTGDTRDIFDGSEFLRSAREHLEASVSVTPDCSATQG